MTLANQKFDQMKNGYNRYQVDDFVERQGREISQLQIKVDLYQQRCEDLQQQLAQMKEKYNHVVDHLSVKEKAMEEMTRMAMKEANMIVDTANQNADFIVKEALVTARSLLMEIARLGGEATQMKGTMEEQLQQLSFALDELEIPEIPDLNLLNK